MFPAPITNRFQGRRANQEAARATQLVQSQQPWVSTRLLTLSDSSPSGQSERPDFLDFTECVCVCVCVSHLSVLVMGDPN